MEARREQDGSARTTVCKAGFRVAQRVHKRVHVTLN